MVFPAHLTSGGKVLLADLPADERSELYALERWEDRLDERPDPEALERELAVVRDRGFAINKDRTESGVTAIGRGIRVGDRIEAAVTVSLPTVRFQEDRLVDIVSALALTSRDIEHEMLTALRTQGLSRRRAQRHTASSLPPRTGREDDGAGAGSPAPIRSPGARSGYAQSVDP